MSVRERNQSGWAPNSTEPLRHTHTLHLLQKPGWIPETPWEELQDLRARHLEHLYTPHTTENAVHLEYERKQKAYSQELKGKLKNRREEIGGYIAPSDFSREARELTPPENELVNARIEEQAWIDTLIEIGQEVKDIVDERGHEWQAFLGARVPINGLQAFADGTRQASDFLSRSREVFGNVAQDGGAFDRVIEILSGFEVEARRMKRIYDWLGTVMLRPLGNGWLFYEELSAIPDIYDYRERPEEEEDGEEIELEDLNLAQLKEFAEEQGVVIPARVKGAVKIRAFLAEALGEAEDA